MLVRRSGSVLIARDWIESPPMDRETDDWMPIPEDVLRLFGQKLRTGYMSTVRPDGDLSVVPVAVMVHDGKVRISTPSNTRKVHNLERDPHIAVCVMDPDNPLHYVMIRGVAELADDKDRAFINWLARTHMGVDEYPHESRDVARTVITIRPHRFAMPKVQGQK